MSTRISAGILGDLMMTFGTIAVCDASSGVAARTACPDCQGTGIFSGPEDQQWDCVACKKQGWVFVSY